MYISIKIEKKCTKNIENYCLKVTKYKFLTKNKEKIIAFMENMLYI